MIRTPLLCALVLISLTSVAQPTVKSADLAVVARMTDLDDNFAYVALAAIPAGSVLFITDEGYDDNGFVFDGTEDVFKWTVNSEIPAGTIVKFTNESTTTLELRDATHGSLQSVNGTSDLSLSAGDQLFLYQTDNNVYNGTMQRLDENGAAEPGLIYAFNGDNSAPSTNGWLNPGNAHTSAASQAPANMTVLTTSDGSGNAPIANANGMLTQGLTNNDAFGADIYEYATGEFDNYVYDGPMGAASKADWLTRLHTTSNWRSSDYDVFCISPDDVFCAGNYLTQDFVVANACTDPDIPTLTLGSATACDGATTVMSITGNLNDATAWHVYTGSCGTTSIGTTSTSTFNVSPSTTTTYFVRGEGGCVTPASCGAATLTVNSLDNASFSYAASSFCTDAADPSPTITGLSGGTFTSTAGLSIGASSGTIDISASTPGTYTVTYTTAWTCPNSATASITINGIDNAAFSYSAAAYCAGDADPSPTVTGVTGGTFSSTAGLSINGSTGSIDVSASTPGTYTVTYTTAGSCPNSSNVSVTVNSLDNASFSYAASSFCTDAADPSPTITGLSGGTFTSTAGLSIGASSGTIDISASTPGTYTVTYTTAGTCPNSATASITINGMDNAAFSYSAAAYCAGDADPSPTVTGVTGGTFSSTAGLSINGSTGSIDVSASTPGTYTVTYTTAGSCPNSSNVSVTVNSLDNASFSYSASSFCTDATDPSPTITGLSGGTFTSTAGLSIDSSSGTIDVSASTPGTYTVTYTTAGTCPNSATASITINGMDNAAFSYAESSVCANAADPSPTVTGLTGGSFSSTAGLAIASASGSIDLANSTAGAYTVTYSTAGSCPNSSSTNLTVVAADDASFSYSSASYFQADANPSPTVTGLSGGAFSADSPDLSINTSTGEVNISASTLGSYTITYSTSGSCPNSSTFNLSLSQDLAELPDFTTGQGWANSIYLEYRIEQLMDSINILRAAESLAPLSKLDFLDGQVEGTRIFMQFDVQGMIDALNDLNAPD